MLTGGRGKAGGIKLADTPAEAEAARRGDPRPRHPRPRRAHALDRAARPTSTASTTSRSRSTAAPSSRCSCSRRGRRRHRGGRGRDARAARAAAHRPARRLPSVVARQLCFGAGDAAADEHKQVGAIIEAPTARSASRRDARRDQPADRHGRRRGARARRQVHDRRQRALPPPRHRRDARRRGGRPAGADGAREGRHLRQARRRGRHPRQRRRARDVHARRRRAGRRPPGQLPRRRRRRAGRGDRDGARGHPLRPQGAGDPVQHLRRHHALRRGRAGHPRRRSSSSTSACRSWCGSTAPTTRRAAQLLADADPPNVYRRAHDARRGARARRARGKALPDGDPRDVRDARSSCRASPAARARFHAPRNRDYGTRSSPASRPARAARTSTASRSSTPSPRPSSERAPTPRWCSCRRGSPPTRSTRRSTRASTPSSASPRASRRTTCSTSTPTSAPRGVTLLGPELPRRALAGRRQRRHHPDAGLHAGPRRPRLALGHADLPDRQRAGPGRRRQLDDRRHRRRPDRRLDFIDILERFEADARDRARRDGRRDRRRRGGEGGRVHRRAHEQAGGRLHRRLHRRRPARRWATPARSSPARRAPPQAKKEALEARGIRVGTNPTEAAQLVAEAVRARR